MAEKFILRPDEPVPAYDPDADSVVVPEDYVQTCATLLIAKLKANGFTAGVSVAVNTIEPQVAITFARRTGGGYVLRIDCLKGWIAKDDPEELARGAIHELIERMDRKQLEN